MLPCRMLAAIWLVLTVTHLSKAVETASPSGASAATAKEIEALKAKAEKGDAESQCNLGSNYINGIGVTKDEVEGRSGIAKLLTRGIT
jgi:TPR repeat protein